MPGTQDSNVASNESMLKVEVVLIANFPWKMEVKVSVT